MGNEKQAGCILQIEKDKRTVCAARDEKECSFKISHATSFVGCLSEGLSKKEEVKKKSKKKGGLDG